MKFILEMVSVVLAEAPRVTASVEAFEAELNEILDSSGSPSRLERGHWRTSADTDADALLRQVLLDRSDVAGCQRGDVQVEMVASSAQVRLGAGTTIVDYGAGLGRMGDGLSSAREFGFARYIAVDQPIRDELRKLVASFGSSCSVMERDAYLSKPVQADVVLVVNTLHHVPFADLARQFGVLLRAMNSDGILVLHEMGALDPPEQRNVPWSMRRIATLLECPALRLVTRETTTRGKGIPLAHVIARMVGRLDDVEDRLRTNADRVWREMKTDVLAQISALYAEGDAGELSVLRRALIHNANLDLNPPPSGPPASGL